MMKKRLLLVVVMLLACGSYAVPACADIGLYDWSVNIDGTVSNIGLSGDPVPGGMDTSLFDDVTGLGTITVTISAPGDHFVGLFVDHEIDQTVNTYFNETGAAVGTPAAGQTWEIDEPGWVNGDIYENLQWSDATGSWLDNGIGTSIYGDTAFPDDVSMAIGWEFSVALGFPAIVEFYLSDVAPLGGFYLIHNDPDSGASVYFSSDFSVVPLPGAVVLAGIGLGVAGRLIGGKRRREAL